MNNNECECTVNDETIKYILVKKKKNLNE